MIKSIEKAILYNRQKERCFKFAKNALPFSYHYQVLSELWADKISEIYDSYQGCKEFLYVASKDEIKEVLHSDKMCYMGMVDETNQLVGVLKISELQFPYPFFVVPKQEQNEQAKFFGISGLLVDPSYRKQGVAKHLVEEAVRCLQRLGAIGVYADCDFRNEASFMTFSSQFNFVGFVDGRTGKDGEKSIYITFYYDLQEKVKNRVESFVLDFSTFRTKDEVVCCIEDNVVDKLGNFSSYNIRYGNGYNRVCVLDKPVDIMRTELVLGQYWKRTLQSAPVLWGNGVPVLKQNKGVSLL